MPFMKTDHTKIVDADIKPGYPYAVYTPDGKDPTHCVSHKAAVGVSKFSIWPVQDLSDPSKR